MEMFVSCSKLGNTVKCFWNRRLYVILTAYLRKSVAINGLCSVVRNFTKGKWCNDAFRNIDFSTTRQDNLESVLFMRTESVVNFWLFKNLLLCGALHLIHVNRCWVNEKISMELDSNLIDSACQCGWVNTTHRHKMLLPTHTLSILHSLSNREKKLNKILYYRPLNVYYYVRWM